MEELYCINCGEDEKLYLEQSISSTDIYECQECGEEIYHDTDRLF